MEEVGDFHFASDSYRSALDYYDAAYQEIVSTADTKRTNRITQKIVDCHLALGSLERAAAILVEARSRVGKSEPEAEGAILSRLARIQSAKGNSQEALRLAAKAVEILRPTAEHSEYANAQVIAAVCHGRLGDQSTFEQMNLDALATYRRVQDEAGIVFVYNNLGLAYKNSSQWTKAIQYLSKAREIAERLGMTKAVASILNNLGIVHTKTREFDQATVYFRQARRHAQALGDHTELIRTLNSMGRALLLSGRHSLAEKYLLQARVLAEKHDRKRSIALADEFLGDLMMAQGKLDEARENYQSGLRLAKAIAPLGDVVAEILRRMAELDLRCGLRSKAISVGRKALKACEQSGETHEMGFIHRTMGIALRELRKPQAAADALRSSIQAFQATHNLYEEAWTRYELASLGLEAGNREGFLSAIHESEKAWEAFRDLEDDVSFCKVGLLLARAHGALGQIDEGLFTLYELERVSECLNQTEVSEAIEALRKSLEAALVSCVDGDSGQLLLFSELYGLTEVSDNETVESKLSRALESLARKVDGAGVFAVIRYRPQGRWQLMGNHNIDPQVALDLTRVFENEEPRFGIRQVDDDLRSRFPHLEQQARYVAWHPLYRDKEVFGWLYLERSIESSSMSFSQDEVDLFATYANLASIILTDLLFDHESVRDMSVGEKLNPTLSRVITRDAGMYQVLSLAQKVAASSCTVMLSGETGTGKGLLADCIHKMSGRHHKKFIAINCAALPESLLESELFGHVRGAFTGADHDKVGLFEAADGGTVFLDEVGKTSLVMQAKLLQFLDASAVRPVGSNEFRRVNVRIICASKANLKHLVEEGKFLEDLYYRLSDFPIQIPPLKDRSGDAEILSLYYLKRYSDEMGKRSAGFSKAVLRLFQHYNWPGNVRELSKCVKRAVILADEGQQIATCHLPAELNEFEVDAKDKPCVSLREQIARLEKNVLRSCLENTGGNKAEAARQLGISYPSLLQKLKLYDVG